MTWRAFLLTIVAAAVAGLLLAHQFDTRTIRLNTNTVSQASAGAYLGRARAEAPQLWGADDTVLLRAGVGLCKAIERLPDAAVAPRPVEGLTGPELYAITDAATRHLCPDQRHRVTDYLRDAR